MELLVLWCFEKDFLYMIEFSVFDPPNILIVIIWFGILSLCKKILRIMIKHLFFLISKYDFFNLKSSKLVSLTKLEEL